VEEINVELPPPPRTCRNCILTIVYIEFRALNLIRRNLHCDKSPSPRHITQFTIGATASAGNSAAFVGD
jgi:hypothetical protein